MRLIVLREHLGLVIRRETGSPYHYTLILKCFFVKVSKNGHITCRRRQTLALHQFGRHSQVQAS